MKRAKIELIRLNDEKAHVNQKTMLCKVKTEVTFKRKQGRRDLSRLKAYFLDIRDKKIKSMKMEGKTRDEIRLFDMQTAFEAFDTDGGGSIDGLEFGELLAALGIKLGEDEEDIALKKIDKEGYLN